MSPQAASPGVSSHPGRICTTTTASSSSPTSAGRRGRRRTAARSWARSRPASPSIPPRFAGCGCPPRRRPLALTATGWWTRPTSSGSPPPVARPARRGMHHGRHRGRGPLHRRLLLLEAHWCLTRRPCPPGPTPPAGHNPQPQAGLPAPDRSPTTGPVTAMMARHRRWPARATIPSPGLLSFEVHRPWHTAWLAGRFPPSGPIRNGAGDEFLL